MKSSFQSVTPADAPLPATVAASIEVLFGSAEKLAGELAHDMAQAWKQGHRLTADELLAKHPDLRTQRDAVLRLVCEEICLRREHNMTLVVDAWVRPFPEWRHEIEALLECQKLIEPEIAAEPKKLLGKLHGFQLLSKLGQGGLGRVYLASQPELADRAVVVKVTPCRGREHESLARLWHQHIVPLLSVHDDPAENQRILCMPYCGSVTLAHLQAKLQHVPLAERTGAHVAQALDEAERHRPPTGLPRGPARQLLARATYAQAIVWMGASLAEALQYAHERQLLHLDIKPTNVLWTTEGQPMLLDFHLARPPIRAEGTRPQGLGGTPMWMAPEHEQALQAVLLNRPIPHEVDARADIFALGLLLHHALGGAVPCRIDKPPRLEQINPQVSPGLADIVRRCLLRDPERRYPDADSLANDLRRHLSDLPLRGVKNRMGERWRKWRRRHPHALLSLLLTALMVAVVGAAAGWLQWQRAQHARRDEALQRDAAARIAQAEKALAQAKTHLQKQKFELALVTLDAGKALLPEGPETQALLRAFHEHRQSAQRHHQRRLLHEGMEELRAAVVAERLRSAQVAALEGKCRELWDSRAAILAESEAADAPARQDVIDLAVIWSELSLRQTPAADIERARRKLLGILDEAAKRCGGSALLDAERTRHRRALGHEAPMVDRPPLKLAAWEHVAVARQLLQQPDEGRSAAELIARLASGSPAERLVAAGLSGARTSELLTGWHLERALIQEPDHYWAHFYQGIAAYRQRRFGDAVTAFRIVIALRPRHPGGYHNRALAAAGAGDLSQAFADYSKALAVDPDFHAAAWNRALIHVKMGNYDAALADLRLARASGADPRAIEADIQRVGQLRKTMR
ncbi:MAG: protein kinase [Gemmataceae bacterium]|nr:protein kinase [Gemmataceae bacterium]